ncbi:metallophosphoesterase [Flavobacterium orientale]|uniref:acid phosphatase n=1 Tax=Flavobacterium orientale TaxID=1756020 RepID=A0A916XX11_9FLAO|nr:metallophosphoesterase [Flavobacterium orientale]GGD17787.1 acid phosphatase [Flavobacterium orientale]
MRKNHLVLVFLVCFQFTQAQKYLEEEKSGYKGGFIPELKILEDSENFLVLGDFGRHGDYYQKDVATQMTKAAATLDSDFVISVGDNFYPNGVQSTQDLQWTASFESIYSSHQLQNDWFVTLGNHDYNGNIQAQIDYSQISRRWQLPNQYYKKIIGLKNGSKMLLVFIDTNPFIDSYHSKGDEMEANVKQQDTTAQRKWLIETLNTTDASIKWKLVIGHHPMYSGGKRKDNIDTKNMETKFASLFDRYKVDAYLCGHEHDLQVIKPKNRYTTQFLSGAGCEVRPTGTREGTLFALSEPGFMAFSVNEKTLLVQLVTAAGKIVYTTELNK